MCFKKPGPRCSAHAMAQIKSIHSRSKSEGWTPQLNAELNTAMENFYETPDGIAYLKEKGDEDAANNYTQIRKNKIALCKKLAEDTNTSPYESSVKGTATGESLYVSAADQLAMTHQMQYNKEENTLY